MVRILQVVFYELDNPMHGGQIRCQQINQKLRETGFSVTLLTIFSLSGAQTSLGPQINLSEDYRDSILDELSQTFPYAEYENYLQTREGLAQLHETVDVDDFDVVWEEHPFIHKSLRAHFERRKGGHPRFVYSSHNVEAELIEKLLDNHEGPTDVKKEICQKVTALEEQAVKDADVILATSHSDLSTFAIIGTQARLVYAPNASRPLFKDNLHLDASVISNLALSRYALFIGSGHPPNASGFLTILGDNLEYLHPDFQIVCVGGVSLGLLRHFDSMEDSTLPLSRLRLLVDASNDVIDQLRLGASVILLPILVGGGSNSKTAEALLSPTKILATPHSFRAFEAYSKHPGVYLSNSRSDFRKILAKISRESEDFEFVRTELEGHPLTWDKALSQIDGHLLRGN